MLSEKKRSSVYRIARYEISSSSNYSRAGCTIGRSMEAHRVEMELMYDAADHITSGKYLLVSSHIVVDISQCFLDLSLVQFITT